MGTLYHQGYSVLFIYIIRWAGRQSDRAIHPPMTQTRSTSVIQLLVVSACVEGQERRLPHPGLPEFVFLQDLECIYIMGNDDDLLLIGLL